MAMPSTPTARPWIIWLLVIDGLLVVAYLAGHLSPVESWFLTDLLSLNQEGNIPSWYASSKLLLIALVWAQVALIVVSRPWLRRGAWAVAGLFVLMSMDETAQIHEHVAYSIDKRVLPTGDRNDTAFSITGVWMFILGPPALLILGGAFYCIGRLIDPRLLALFMTGVVVLVGSATGIETLVNFTEEGSVMFYLQAAAEELGEMLGATLLLLGSLRACRVLLPRSTGAELILMRGEPTASPQPPSRKPVAAP